MGSGYFQWQWQSGTGDGSNQPIIYGHRLPTAEEMKRGPICCRVVACWLAGEGRQCCWARL
ncbi:hypothetical protein FXN61_16575 [Lentzea sp. PSKA42]|uniref:Uncharacterized protein n=1 Tax=Lentzea indica TaxID=2604800 RepID=A0ABX1FI89_9PSEU|nr:hypothetical protein [Lentzea indica]NKE58351.1 hypothetical protein [Lentzea indica]